MTIQYVEKGIGMHEVIRAAGYVLREENGAWVCDDVGAVQTLIDTYSLDQAKARKCADVLARAKFERDKAVRAVSSGEMAGWPVKLSEAQKFGADPSADCPMLSAEANNRGITLAELVAKVNNNAATFAALEAKISGNDGRHRDAINAAATFEAVSAYDFSSGWE